MASLYRGDLTGVLSVFVPSLYLFYQILKKNEKLIPMNEHVSPDFFVLWNFSEKCVNTAYHLLSRVFGS